MSDVSHFPTLLIGSWTGHALIQALKVAPTADQALITHALQNKSQEHMSEILTIVEKSGALAYTHAAAVTETNLALACLAKLPDTPYKTALSTLATFSLSRLA